MARHELTCTVTTRFLPEQSEEPQGPFAYAYTVRIVNTGDIPAQVIARHWVITDAEQNTEEVRGLAVVGRQPLLAPGEEFEYTSWTRIATPQGTMQGTLYCMTEAAEPFEAPIAPFRLGRSEGLH